MTDDSIEIQETLDFHPCDSPRGVLYYNLPELTPDQQTKLNDKKIDTIRENEQYLAAHPEIRAIIALIMRLVFRHRPMLNVHEFIAKYFTQSTEHIEKDIQKYILSRKSHTCEAQSATDFIKNKKKEFEKVKYPTAGIERSSSYVCHQTCPCLQSRKLEEDKLLVQGFADLHYDLDFSGNASKKPFIKPSETDFVPSTPEKTNPTFSTQIKNYYAHGEDDDFPSNFPLNLPEQTSKIDDGEIFEFLAAPTTSESEFNEETYLTDKSSEVQGMLSNESITKTSLETGSVKLETDSHLVESAVKADSFQEEHDQTNLTTE